MCVLCLCVCVDECVSAMWVGGATERQTDASLGQYQMSYAQRRGRQAVELCNTDPCQQPG